MKWFDRWAIKHTTWIKPFDELTLQELSKLQQDIGNAIAKKLEVQNWEKQMENKK